MSSPYSSHDNVVHAIKKIKTGLSNKENWKIRYKALEDLEKLIHNGSEAEGFDTLFESVSHELKIVLANQLIDLRSEIVRQACNTISTMADLLQESMSKLAAVLIPNLLVASSTVNKVIRGYAVTCMHKMIENVPGRGMLMPIITTVRETKSKQMRPIVMEFLEAVLANWPTKLLYKKAVEIENTISFGLDCPTGDTRNSAARTFFLFLQHFPKKEKQVIARLPSRGAKIVEKMRTNHGVVAKLASPMKSDRPGSRARTPTTRSRRKNVAGEMQRPSSGYRRPPSSSGRSNVSKRSSFGSTRSTSRSNRTASLRKSGRTDPNRPQTAKSPRGVRREAKSIHNKFQSHQNVLQKSSYQPSTRSKRSSVEAKQSYQPPQQAPQQAAPQQAQGGPTHNQQGYQNQGYPANQHGYQNPHGEYHGGQQGYQGPAPGHQGYQGSAAGHQGYQNPPPGHQGYQGHPGHQGYPNQGGYPGSPRQGPPHQGPHQGPHQSQRAPQNRPVSQGDPHPLAFSLSFDPSSRAPRNHHTGGGWGAHSTPEKEGRIPRPPGSEGMLRGGTEGDPSKPSGPHTTGHIPRPPWSQVRHIQRPMSMGTLSMQSVSKKLQFDPNNTEQRKTPPRSRLPVRTWQRMGGGEVMKIDGSQASITSSFSSMGASASRLENVQEENGVPERHSDTSTTSKGYGSSHARQPYGIPGPGNRGRSGPPALQGTERKRRGSRATQTTERSHSPDLFTESVSNLQPHTEPKSAAPNNTAPNDLNAPISQTVTSK